RREYVFHDALKRAALHRHDARVLSHPGDGYRLGDAAREEESRSNARSMSADLAVLGLGRMAYGEALELQRRLARKRIEKTIDRDLLLLVEHPPVVTLGRGFRPDSLPAPRAFLEAKGIEVFEIERGGDVTFHGPGQLVGYPIFDLTEHRSDLHWFLRRLEEALIVSLSEFGI